MDWRQPRLRVTGGVKGGGNYGCSQRDRKKRGLVVTGKAFPVAVECVPSLADDGRRGGRIVTGH